MPDLGASDVILDQSDPLWHRLPQSWCTFLSPMRSHRAQEVSEREVPSAPLKGAMTIILAFLGLWQECPSFSRAVRDYRCPFIINKKAGMLGLQQSPSEWLRYLLTYQSRLWPSSRQSLLTSTRYLDRQSLQPKANLPFPQLRIPLNPAILAMWSLGL